MKNHYEDYQEYLEYIERDVTLAERALRDYRKFSQGDLDPERMRGMVNTLQLATMHLKEALYFATYLEDK